MSKIALPIAELKPALTGFGKIISKRTTLPVLNHLKIERTKDGWIAITATDFDHFVTYRLEQPGDGEPTCLLVPYDELLKITKNCPKNDKILVTSDENASEPSVILEYAVGNQVAEVKVESLPVEEFPETPRIKGDPIPVNDALRQSIHEALECASVDETRLILNGAYIDVSKPEANYVVGTDGRHLFSSNSFSLPLKDSIIIPSHKFIGWKEFNNDGEWQLKVEKPEKKDESGHLQISTRRWRYIARQIEGNYPNWRQVIPSEFKTTVEFDPSSIDAVVQIIERMPCDDAVNLAIGLQWKDRKVSLLGRNPNAEKLTIVQIEDAKGKGDDITIFFNRHLLIKALQFGLTTVETIDALSPLRFSKDGRQMIVMPTRRGETQATPAPTQPAENTPAASSPAAQQPERNDAMPRTPSSNGNEQPVNKPALDVAVEKVEAVKTSIKSAVTGLNELLDTLKQAQRDQKTADKEVQSVRSTLEKLQTMKF